MPTSVRWSFSEAARPFSYQGRITEKITGSQRHLPLPASFAVYVIAPYGLNLGA